MLSTLSSLFGIEENNYEQIIDISKPIATFISSGSLGSSEDREILIHSIENTENNINYCIENCQNEQSFVGYLLKNNIDINKIKPLLINTLIDGYDPLLSIIAFYFYTLSKKIIIPQNISSSELFNEIIRLEPLFQYCSRIALNNIEINNYLIKKGERVIAFLSSANRDPCIFSN